MSRIAKTLAVPPTVFRHFAVATIIITAFIGLFADGESRQSIEDHLKEKQQLAAMKRQEMQAREQNRLALNFEPKGPSIHSGGGGDDFGMEAPSGGNDSPLRTQSFAQAAPPPGTQRLMPLGAYRGNDPRRPRVLPKGMAPEDYMAGDPSQPSDRVGAVREISEDQYNQIVAASESRSSGIPLAN